MTSVTNFFQSKIEKKRDRSASSKDKDEKHSNWKDKMLEKVEKVERERMVAAAAERKGPFEEYIFVPRAISFPTARWTKMWFVLDDESITAFKTKDSRMTFRISVNEILTITDVKLKCTDATSEEGVVILGLTFNRTFAFGRIPDRSVWREFVTFLYRYDKPRSSKSVDMSTLQIHSDHFMYDTAPPKSRKDEIPLSVMETICSRDFFQEGTPHSLPENLVVRQISSSKDHAIAVTVDGRAFVWGVQKDRHYPILGLGHNDRYSQMKPVELQNPFGVNERISKAVSGMVTSALISTRGQVALWGLVVAKGEKKPGRGASISSSLAKSQFETVMSPKLFAPLEKKYVSSLATYAEICCAIIRVPGLDDVTEVWSWGSNAYGLLGHATKIEGVFEPHEVEALKDEAIVDLSVSDTHVICANAKGEVYIWGKNVYVSSKGEVSNILGPTELEKQRPKIIQVPLKVKSFGEGKIVARRVEAGSYHSLVLGQCKKVYSWGYSGPSLRLGQPISKLQRTPEGVEFCEQLLFLQNPSPVPDVEQIDDINTNGLFSIAKTSNGALYSWGLMNQVDKQKPTDRILNVYSEHESFIMACSAFGKDQTVVVKGSHYAWIAHKSDKKRISATWHVYVSHLTAFVSRVWGGLDPQFVILDALGNACLPTERTNRLIQRMLLRGVTPVFIVTDLEAILRVYQHRVWLKGVTIRWAFQDALLSLLYMFPPSVLTTRIGTIVAEAKPKLNLGFHEVFFLTYSDRFFNLTRLEIFNYLLDSYEALSEIHSGPTGSVQRRAPTFHRRATQTSLRRQPQEKERRNRGMAVLEEPWIPSGLDRSLIRAIQAQLPRTRMLRILFTIRKWLKHRPRDFFESTEIVGPLLNFLQFECENPIHELSTAALRLRRKAFQKMASLSTLFLRKFGQLKEVEEHESSLLLRVPPKVIAQQLTWIDANLIFSQVSSVDILHQKIPKSVQRHVTLANWVEKELLMETPKNRQKMTENVIEIMYHLYELRNFFSYTSFYGALLQKPIRRITDNVWETGVKKSPVIHSYWKTLTKPEVKEQLMVAVKFNLYFESLPEPKIPYLGHSFNKLIYIGEKYKTFEPPEIDPEKVGASATFSPSSPLPFKTTSPLLSSTNSLSVSATLPISIPTSPSASPATSLSLDGPPPVPARSSSPSSSFVSGSPPATFLSPKKDLLSRQRPLSPGKESPPSLITPPLSLPQRGRKGTFPVSPPPRPIRSSPREYTPSDAQHTNAPSLSPSPSPRSTPRSSVPRSTTPSPLPSSLEIPDSPPQSPLPSPQLTSSTTLDPKSLVLFERCQAEAESVLWLKTVFERAPGLYAEPPFSIHSDTFLVPLLMHIEGFKSDPRQHRKIANNFGKDKNLNETDEKETETINIFENLSSIDEIEQDVETVLLTGRASFISLSDRLRNEAWGQWLEEVQNESKKARGMSDKHQFFIDLKGSAAEIVVSGNGGGMDSEPISERTSRRPTAQSPKSGPPPGLTKESAAWNVVHSLLQKMKRIGSISQGFFSEGTVPFLLLRSEALEVTFDTFLESYPKKESLAKFEMILILLTGNKELCQALIAATREVHDFIADYKHSPDSDAEILENISGAVWSLVSLIKLYQPFLFDFEAINYQLRMMNKLVQKFQNLIQTWEELPHEKYKEIEDNVWEGFTSVESLVTTIRGSLLWILSGRKGEREASEEELDRLMSPKFVENQLSGVVDVIDSLRQKKQLREMSAHTQHGEEFISLLAKHISQTEEKISATKQLLLQQDESSEKKKERKEKEREEERKAEEEEKRRKGYSHLKRNFEEAIKDFLDNLSNCWADDFDSSSLLKLFVLVKDVIFPDFEKKSELCSNAFGSFLDLFSRLREFTEKLLRTRHNYFKMYPNSRLVNRDNYLNVIKRMDYLGMQGEEGRSLYLTFVEEEEKKWSPAFRNAPSVSTKPRTAIRPNFLRPPNQGFLKK